MNWKNRILNKTTLLSLIGVVIYFIYTLLKILGFVPDAQQFRDMYDCLACIIMFSAILGIITDPNTPGITDGGSHEEHKENKGQVMADLNKFINRMQYWCNDGNLGYDQLNR